jgi:hypothetical protein
MRGSAGFVARFALVWLGLIGCGHPTSSERVADDSLRRAATDSDSVIAVGGWWARLRSVLGFSTVDTAAVPYGRRDSAGIPRYITRPFSQEDSLILRRAYGIEDPHRLYLSDSTPAAILKYDTRTKPCRGCLVNSYDVGFVSVRAPGESWEQVEHRVRATRARHFTGKTHPSSASTVDLDPRIRPAFEQMLIDAAMAGFKLHVIATYRSPMRQAYLMSLGGNRTHTLTSLHSYGRALDAVVDDGNRAHKRTKADWIAFRTWVTNYRAPTGERFRVVGALDHTWDWPHVEIRGNDLGFHSVEEALARGRACIAPGATASCDFTPVLPDQLAE